MVQQPKTQIQPNTVILLLYSKHQTKQHFFLDFYNIVLKLYLLLTYTSLCSSLQLWFGYLCEIAIQYVCTCVPVSCRWSYTLHFNTDTILRCAHFRSPRLIHSGSFVVFRCSHLIYVNAASSCSGDMWQKEARGGSGLVFRDNSHDIPWLLGSNGKFLPRNT